MDYEKKYKEALKDMRAIYPNLKGDAKLAVEHAFPELRESEDERMINELQGFLCSFGLDYFGNGEWQKFDDWLEKQKEQKPSTEETELNSIAFLEQMGYTCIPPKEQKPAEWSKEEGYLEYWLEQFGMPKENIENCADQIAQGYGASRYLEGVQVGAEAVNELGKQEKCYDEAYLNECIAKARKTWEGVDADKYMDEVRGREQEQPEVELEKASRNVYESWMGGTMDDFLRDMVELGKALNTRKEE